MKMRRPESMMRMPRPESMRKLRRPQEILAESTESSRGGGLTADAALGIVKHEAMLRQGQRYLEKTTPYVQKGLPPPVEFDQEVQRLALEEKGYDASSETVRRYQHLVQTLPLEERQEVFFLRANDRFFHPEIDPKEKSLDASLPLAATDGAALELRDLLGQAREQGCRKVFLLASTST